MTGELTVRGEVVYRVGRAGFGVCFSAFSQGAARDRLAAIIGVQDEGSPSNQ